MFPLFPYSRREQRFEQQNYTAQAKIGYKIRKFCVYLQP